MGRRGSVISVLKQDDSSGISFGCSQRLSKLTEQQRVEKVLHIALRVVLYYS